MPWTWLYTARVTTSQGRIVELPVRAKNAADAERLTRLWAAGHLPGSVTVTVQVAVPEAKGPAALRTRFGRLTQPDVKVYEPGQVAPGAVDYRNGIPIYREPPASAADIAEAEHRLGLSLPAAYRDFLLWSNGGQTTTGIVLFAAGQIFCLDEKVTVTIRHPWLVAIGIDDGGDTLCIASSEEVLMAHHDPLGVQTLNSTFEGWLRGSLA